MTRHHNKRSFAHGFYIALLPSIAAWGVIALGIAALRGCCQ